MTFVLRPRQVDVVERTVSRMRAGVRALCIVAPPGFGKTVVGAHIGQRVVAKGKRMNVLCHRKELIDQMSAKLDALGLDHGVIKAGHPRVRPDAPIQVASVQTLANRDIPAADVLLVDEAHHSEADSFSRIIEFHEQIQAWIVGLTASPYRLDERPLRHFHELVVGAQVQDLIDEGLLVRPVTYSFEAKRAQVAKAQRGRCAERYLMADVVKTWQRYASGRATVCFALDVKHSLSLVERFLAAGISAEHVDAKSTDDVREGAVRRSRTGETRVLCNVELFSEGTDMPWISCVDLARWTDSLSFFVQACGRGLRIDPENHEKRDCRILDHAGNSENLDFRIEEPIEFTLEGKARPRGAGVDGAPGHRTCSECFSVVPSGLLRCPGLRWDGSPCGHVFTVRERQTPREREGELKELERRRRAAIPEATRARMLAKWIRRGMEAGWQSSAAYLRYLGHFGERVDPATAAAARRIVETEMEAERMRMDVGMTASVGVGR